LVPGNGNKGLGGQIVDFVWPRFPDRIVQGRLITQVTWDQFNAAHQVAYAIRPIDTGSADQPADLIASCQEKLGEV